MSSYKLWDLYGKKVIKIYKERPFAKIHSRKKLQCAELGCLRGLRLRVRSGYKLLNRDGPKLRNLC